MRNAMMFLDPFVDDGRLVIEHAVQKITSPFTQNVMGKPESGGILLGFRRGDHLHIVSATEPQADDRQSRFHFIRQDRHHQNEAFRHWNASGEKMDYLGEWHTHPELNPSPSGHDICEWRKISIQRAVPMVFMIVGTQGNLWVGVGISNIVRQCEICDDF